VKVERAMLQEDARFWPALGAGVGASVATVLHLKRRKQDRLADVVGVLAAASTVGMLIWRSRSAHLVRAKQRLSDADMKKYGLTHRGFLPDVCCERLPPSHEAWEELSAQLPALNRSGKFRAALEAMPMLSVEGLTEEQMRRAYIILTQFSTSYLNAGSAAWGAVEGDETFVPTVVPRELPDALAVPLHAVALELGLPPVVTTTLDLWNFKFVKRNNGGPFGPRDIACISTSSGNAAESGLHTVLTAMQSVVGPIVPELVEVHKAMAVQDNDEVERVLNNLLKVLTRYVDMMKDVWNLVDPSGFYDVYRPFLNGYYDESESGVEFKGVDPKGTLAPTCRVVPREGKDVVVSLAKGNSAGQSTQFVIFDSILGVRHLPDRPMKPFQIEMLDYMPRQHRLLAQDVLSNYSPENGGSIAHYIEAGKGTKVVKDLHKRCLQKLAAVRQSHFRVATTYLKAAAKGTGSSPFRDLLQDAVDATKAMVTGQLA